MIVTMRICSRPSYNSYFIYGDFLSGKLAHPELLFFVHQNGTSIPILPPVHIETTPCVPSQQFSLPWLPKARVETGHMAIDNGSEHVVEAAIHIEDVRHEPHLDQPTNTPWANNNGQHPTGLPPAIAIVGMGMRFPGNIRTGEDFWSMLVDKRSAVGEIPLGRYHGDSFYHPTRPHVVKTKHGYFFQEEYLGKVDPGFVGKPHESGLLDPQQRLLLEVVWECMENAGQSDWRGHDIGCFVGTFGEDWLEVTSKDFQAIDRFRAMGTGDFALANRISFEFDLKGPRCVAFRPFFWLFDLLLQASP